MKFLNFSQYSLSLWKSKTEKFTLLKGDLPHPHPPRIKKSNQQFKAKLYTAESLKSIEVQFTLVDMILSRN